MLNGSARPVLLLSNHLNYALWLFVPFGVHCTTCLGCVLTTPSLHFQIQVLGLRERSWRQRTKLTSKTLLSSSEVTVRSRPESLIRSSELLLSSVSSSSTFLIILWTFIIWMYKLIQWCNISNIESRFRDNCVIVTSDSWNEPNEKFSFALSNSCFCTYACVRMWGAPAQRTCVADVSPPSCTRTGRYI